MTEAKKEVVEDVKSDIKEEVTTKVATDQDKKSVKLSLQEMLKAGVHFGQKKSRWNPKMKKYIFGVRNGVHIIDLEKSLSLFESALKQIDEISKKNGSILIVGTKNQARRIVERAAEEMNMPYVNNRWLGGTFTNFNFIKNRLKFLVNNKEALEQGRLKDTTKLERNKLQKKLVRIEERMGGLVKMTRLPDAVLILDINKDIDAVREARKTGVKVIGLLDTNSDPDLVDLPIPANDDAVSSLTYVLNVIADRFSKAKK